MSSPSVEPVVEADSVINSSFSLDNKQTSDNSVDSTEISDESIIRAPVASNPDEVDLNCVNCDDSDDESVPIRNKKKHNLINSDSDESDESEKENVAPKIQPEKQSEKQTPEKQTPEEQSSGKKKKSRLRQIVDDSDSENDASPLKENNDDIFVTDDADKQKSRLNELVDSDSDDESQLEQDEVQKHQIQNLKNLCDSESEDETPSNVQKNQPQKPKTKTKPEKKMTGRDAKEQMHQIKSESQKMVRESRVSLPYHRPKQHTLQEFLERRRKSLVTSVEISETSFSIKMSAQDLVKAAERLKEREKEIEKFYNDEEEEDEEKTGEDFVEKTTEEPENLTEKTTEESLKTKEDLTEKTTEGTQQTGNDLAEEKQTEETLENLLEDLQKTVEEETSQIEELRNVLIDLSSGNMEQLQEDPETSSENQTKEAPEKLAEEAPSKTIEDETPEKLLEKKFSNLTPIIALKKDFKPRLTGFGGDIIVLNEDVERSKGVSDLMKRFLLHTNKPTPKKQQQDVVEELKMEHEPDEAAKKNLIPGLKFKKLKANLEEQIVLKRMEEWKKKQQDEVIEEKVIEEEEEECEEDISEEESSEDSEEEEDDVILEDAPKTKSAFVDDEAEDSDSESEVEDEAEAEEEKQPLKRIIIQEDSDSDSDEREEITAYQPLQSEKTPLKSIQENKDLSNFLTPTLHLTALQGMTSTTKSLQDSPGIVLSPDPSPLRLPPSLKTKLFPETEDIHMEDLEDLCSGKFTGPTQPQPTEIISSEGPENPGNGGEGPEYQIEFDEASLELKNETQIPLEFRQFNTNKFVIVSSDEEDDLQEVKKPKKKKYIIDDISISDDDEEQPPLDLDDEVDELEEDGDEQQPLDFIDDEVEELEEDETAAVDYDSEENEVEFQTNPRNLRDYFEAEAELSGSDWDSADEDEKGLDDFEAEEGDADKISEKKLQRELGRIHAHTVMEEDKQDVRLLQELLLEDGELHGAGREKKFKWKNAESNVWGGEDRPPDDDEEIEEVENESEWRKMRHEREMFLAKQQKSEDEDPQIMPFILDKSHQKTPIAENNSDIKLPFTLTHKRGSFLMRSETTLARLAEITRSTTTNLTGPKNSRNFVFTTVEKNETIIVEDINEKKRKAVPGTPKILKKMRVAESPQQK